MKCDSKIPDPAGLKNASSPLIGDALTNSAIDGDDAGYKYCGHYQIR